MTNEIKQTRMNESKRFSAKAVGKIAVLGLATLIGACSPAENNSLENKSDDLANVNQMDYSYAAVSNFCEEVAQSKDFESKRKFGWDSDVEASKNRTYVLKLTEIIASLKGDDYSLASYKIAKAEFHKAVEAYTK
jgi:hypothetical protein